MTTTLEVCADCAAVLESNDFSGMSEARAAEVKRAISALEADVTSGANDCDHDECRESLLDGFGFPDSHYEYEHDIITFSWNRCDICHSPLGGARHIFTAWTD